MALFIADPRQQHTPGRPGYPRYDATIASSEWPSGAAWLASCLLELGVPLWKPWGIDDRASWESLGAGRWRYRFAGSGWSRLVPGLRHGRRLRLAMAPVPQFTHSWPGQLPLAPRLVLLVRDPRDALHSHWRRTARMDAAAADSLSDFLDGLQPGLPLPRRAYLGWFLSAWRVASAMRPTLVVRFEEAKHAPHDTLASVLAFLRVHATQAGIDTALKRSSHARTVAAERRLLRAGVVPTPLLGPGLANEHALRASAGALSADRRLAAACRWLGYGAVADQAGGDSDDNVLSRLLATLQPGSADPLLLRACLSGAAAT